MTAKPGAWRPIEDWELPLLTAAGARLRELRGGEGLTREFVAREAQISDNQVWMIETGRSRTRRSTLEALVWAIFGEERPELVDELVALYANALAPESQYADRVARRRARRARLREKKERELDEWLGDRVRAWHDYLQDGQ